MINYFYAEIDKGVPRDIFGFRKLTIKQNIAVEVDTQVFLTDDKVIKYHSGLLGYLCGKNFIYRVDRNSGRGDELSLDQLNELVDIQEQETFCNIAAACIGVSGTVKKSLLNMYSGGSIIADSWGAFKDTAERTKDFYNKILAEKISRAKDIEILSKEEIEKANMVSNSIENDEELSALSPKKKEAINDLMLKQLLGEKKE